MRNTRHPNKITRVQEKIVTVLLYVLRGLATDGRADKHSVFKTIYLADKAKLADYGVPIIEDTYIKMAFGPVPSIARDIVEKAVSKPGSKVKYFDISVHDLIQSEGDFDLIAKAYPNMRHISRLDAEYLDTAIEAIKAIGIGPKGMNKRTESTHDSAWQSVEMNNPIPTKSILVAGNASQEVLELFDQHTELESIFDH
jgi:hypothetical protein